MARRATPVTKERTTSKKAAAPETVKPSRRGKAKQQDESPAELPTLDAADDTMPVNETETMAPKPRRGRRSKAEMSGDDASIDASAAPDMAPSAEPELPAMEIAEPDRPAPKAKAPKPAGSPRTTRRNREPEASAPPPIEMADEPASETPSVSAVEWHADSGSVTFDWPAIEAIAAAEGVNQPMAKLLLAARAEGARSRWPF